MKTTRLGLGALFCLIGAIWIGQGVNVIKGSFMTGQAIWAVIGTIMVLAGLMQFRVALRTPEADDADDDDDGEGS